jgi:hypothetical protein
MKRALLVGINYEADKSNRLYGCVNDARNVERRLRAAYPGAEYRVLVDDTKDPALWPCRENILAGLAWLTRGLRAGDHAFLHYSGHGGLTIDRSLDEASGFDSCIFPISMQGQVEFIIDDELRAAVNAVPAGCTLTAVFDCCHSGTCLDLRYAICPAAPPSACVVTEHRRHTKTAGQVICLSGCTDIQTAADTVDATGLPSGALTNALLAALDKSAKLTRLLSAVREGLREGGYTQLPQMSCGRAAAFDTLFLPRPMPAP